MENASYKDDFHIKTKHINTLFHFIKTNKDDQFLEYISHLSYDEIDVNMRDENGNYLIFFAIMMNNRKILKKLMEYGARIDILDSEGYNIMYYPIKFNYLEIIDMLLEYDKKIVAISLINLRDVRGAVPLFYAIRYKNHHALQELLSNGADANYKNLDDMNGLHLAVLKKDITMVKMLIKYINNIDTRTKQGSTALHYACNFLLLDIVKILLDNGARQDIIELEYDFYPIFYTVVQNNAPITKLLIDRGANPNHQDYVGNTVIHYAIMNNHSEILDYIMEKYVIKDKKINVYVEDINNKHDIKGDHIDPNIVNIEGLTITHMMLYNYTASQEKYVVKLIPQANLNYQDNIGNTILHIIAEKNLWEKFTPLLGVKKLNIYIRNNTNKTVFDMIQLRERENFLNTVIKSYYKYLKKYENSWLLEWQNQCSQNSSNQKITKSKCHKHIRNAILNEKNIYSNQKKQNQYHRY